jgi:hypothetical protein
MLAWLNTNANAVIALASTVSAFAAMILMVVTIIYARYTWQLTVENRLLRKAGTDPQVVAYATINPRVYGAIDFVIANIGKGAARNVSYKVAAGGNDLKTKNVRLPLTGITFAFLPQDEQISTSMGMGWDLLAEPPLAPFEIDVEYEDMSGNQQIGQFRIDVAQFEDGWAQRRLQVETISTSERKKLNKDIGSWRRDERSKNK